MCHRELRGGRAPDDDITSQRASRSLPDIDSQPTPTTESWTYDDLGRVSTHTDFMGHVTAYLYDDSTLLTANVSGTELDLAPGYSPVGRLIEERRYVDASAVATGTVAETTRYGYDDLGRQTAVGEFTGLPSDTNTPTRLSTTSTTDDLPNHVRTDTANSPEGVITHEYSTTTGQLLRTFTSSTETVYDYDALGRLWKVSVMKQNGSTLAEPLVTEYAYDLAGNLQTVTQPNGITEDYDYDSLNRLYHVYVHNGDDAIFEQTYVIASDSQRDSVIEKRYDGSGHAVSDVLSNVQITWDYDSDGRLIAETRQSDPDPADSQDVFTMSAATDYADAFTLDLVGNRLGYSHDSVTNNQDEAIIYTVNARDQVMAEDSTINANDKTYAYDANGSQASVATPAGTTHYLWDLRGRMVGIDLNGDGDASDAGDAGVGETEYGYDANGVRVSEVTHASAADQAAVFVNDDANPTGYSTILERRTGTSIASATLDTTYTIGLRVEGQSDPQGQVWFVRDGHGSNRALVDDAGTVVEAYDYQAFGQLIEAFANGPRTIHLFGGDGVYDGASGWTYHLARWRSDFRFVSYDSFEADPASPAGLHKYLYCHGDPINGIDPTGKMEFSLTGLLSSTAVQFILRSLAPTMTASTFVFRSVAGLVTNASWSHYRDYYATPTAEELGRLANTLITLSPSLAMKVDQVAVALVDWQATDRREGYIRPFLSHIGFWVTAWRGYTAYNSYMNLIASVEDSLAEVVYAHTGAFLKIKIDPVELGSRFLRKELDPAGDVRVVRELVEAVKVRDWATSRQKLSEFRARLVKQLGVVSEGEFYMNGKNGWLDATYSSDV